MRIAIGSDHRGLQLKEKISSTLKIDGHEIQDVGTDASESVDYPDYAVLVAKAVSEKKADRGILICGTGIGMSIAANKFPGVRAAPCADEVFAEMSRRHNDLNVLCLAGDMTSAKNAERIVDIWMKTDFEGGRHSRRVEKIGALDKEC